MRFVSSVDAPLTETELLAICHADPSNPAREAGLTLRRYATPVKKPSNKLEHFFGERPPLEASQSSQSGVPKLSLAIPSENDYRAAPSAPSSASSGGGATATASASPPVRTAEQKRMARASTVSVMSGLGILPSAPVLAQAPPSPTQETPNVFQQKIRNFFGHRPPSELITSHLPEYFPGVDKKPLARIARQSLHVNRNSLARASWLSVANEPMPSEPVGRASLDSSPRSRKSSRRRTQRPVRRESAEPVPRVSISNDEGQSIDLINELDDEDELLYKGGKESGPPTPHVLPPVAFSEESFSDSLLPQLGGNAKDDLARRMSRASRRSSVYTEVKSRPSEDATLLTIDEITATVENRRQSMIMGDSESEGTSTLAPDATLAADEDVARGEEDEEDEEEYEDEDEEDELEDEDDVPEDVAEDEEDVPDAVPGTHVLRSYFIDVALMSFAEKVEIKWSKGALIGSGSFGSVYLGLDMSRGLLMAVKQVELPTGSSANEARKKTMLSALEVEIALLKELQHPNIVQYLGACQPVLIPPLK